ncbi:uncharacterized protein LOC136036488 isoform X3 [Artemia franciscana]|uniref:uncharacterized protein LOC136036488 isoform X3 n=1 Tax=Artemia franciscana TaxID=6661 RepID=UPI0032DAD487
MDETELSDHFPVKEEIEGDSMADQINSLVRATNLDVPINDEFGSSVILSQLKHELDFPENSLLDSQNKGLTIASIHENDPSKQDPRKQFAPKFTSVYVKQEIASDCEPELASDFHIFFNNDVTEKEDGNQNPDDGSSISRQINNNTRPIENTESTNMLDTVTSVFTQNDTIQAVP